MDQSAGVPIVLTAPLTESIDHAGFFLWAGRLRRVNGPNFTWPLVQFVAFAFLWLGGRFARVIDDRKSRAIEESGCAVAPFVLFALLWLLDDVPQQRSPV